MRHRVKGRKLGRSTPHRKATLRALSTALIKEHRIETTLPKAKELRTFVEPLITRAKVDSTHNRRVVYSYLQDKYAVTELFETVGPAAADRPGGYTRVLKLGFRVGDAAEMAVIELVDFNDVQPEGKETKKKRTRRAGKAAKTESDAAGEKKDVKADEAKAKAPAKDEEPAVAEANSAEAVVEAQETAEVVEEEVAPAKGEANPEAESDKKSKTEEAKNESEDAAAQQDTTDPDADTESKK